MIELLYIVGSKIESFFLAVKAVIPVVTSEYVTEQTMLAQLNFEWYRTMIKIGIVGLWIIIMVEVIHKLRKTNHYNSMSRLELAGSILGWSLLIASLIAIPILHAEGSHCLINAATPVMHLLREGLTLIRL